MSENKELAHSISAEMGVQLPDHIGMEEMRQALSDFINELIKNNFERLVSYLYRIDVSEQKLKALLLQHPDQDAGNIIAGLIIERQLQKIKNRREFKQQDNSDADGEEKWEP